MTTGLSASLYGRNHRRRQPCPGNALITRPFQPLIHVNTMDALAILRQHEPVLKQRFGIAKVGIFGSFARGEERPDSDIDILVTFQDGKKTFDNFMGTKFYLEDLFGRKVDLVTDAALKPLIRDPILQDVVYA